MSDKPERIWTCRGFYYTKTIWPSAVEYVRADIHDASTARAEAAEAKVEKALVALEEIARQKKTDELEAEYDVEISDFEYGYDTCIVTARAAIAKLRGEGET